MRTNKFIYLTWLKKRYRHASVSMCNKLFVIGGYDSSTCEMFDCYSRKLCYTKTSSEFSSYLFNFQAVCISSQIIVSGESCDEYETQMFTYNIETSEWKHFD